MLILIEKKLKSATHTRCLSSSDSFCAQIKNFKPVHFYKVQYLKRLWFHFILFSLYFQPLNHNRNRKKSLSRPPTSHTANSSVSFCAPIKILYKSTSIKIYIWKDFIILANVITYYFLFLVFPTTKPHIFFQVCFFSCSPTWSCG